MSRKVTLKILKMKTMMDAKDSEDYVLHKGPEYIRRQIEAFSISGSFDRECIGKFLGLDLREGFDFSAVTSPTDLFPILIENIQLVDQEIYDIPCNTLDFLIALTGIDITCFSTEELIVYYVNHMNVPEPNVGHLIIRFLNVLFETNEDVISVAISNGFFDHATELINSIDGENGHTLSLLHDIPDVLVMFCMNAMKLENEEVNQCIWNLGITFIQHPEEDSATIFPGFFLLEKLCQAECKCELTEEFVQTVADFGCDGAIILPRVFSFIIAYGEDLFTALQQTTFFTDIIETAERNTKACPSILYFLADVGMEIDPNGPLPGKLLEYMTDDYSLRINAAAVHLFLNFISSLSKGNVLPYSTGPAIPLIINILEDNHEPVMMDCIKCLTILIQSVNISLINAEYIEAVNYTVGSIETGEYSVELEGCIQELLDLLP